MSDQVHKTLLACDGLNRTGQEAPAIRGKIWNNRRSLQVAISKIRVYTKGKKTSGKECQKWEDGRDRRDNDIHMREQSCDIVDYKEKNVDNLDLELLKILHESKDFNRAVDIFTQAVFLTLKQP